MCREEGEGDIQIFAPCPKQNGKLLGSISNALATTYSNTLPTQLLNLHGTTPPT